MSESACQFATDRAVVESSGASARDYQEIGRRRQARLVPAKKLAHLALDPIAHDRVANFAAHGDAQPASWTVTSLADHDEVRRMKSASGARQIQELRPFTQACRFQEPFATWQRHRQIL